MWFSISFECLIHACQDYIRMYLIHIPKAVGKMRETREKISWPKGITSRPFSAVVRKSEDQHLKKWEFFGRFVLILNLCEEGSHEEDPERHHAQGSHWGELDHHEEEIQSACWAHLHVDYIMSIGHCPRPPVRYMKVVVTLKSHWAKTIVQTTLTWTSMTATSTPTPKMTTTTYYQQQPVETKVMVMERLMSPLRSKVQKLDPVPPGQVPKTKRPSLNWTECR